MIEAFNLIVCGNRVAFGTYRNRPNVPYIQMICGEEVANKMLIQPNAYMPDMDNSKARRIIVHEVLPTELGGTHTMSLRTTEPAISNVYFMVRMNLTEEKALVLWLNSLRGTLTVLWR